MGDPTKSGAAATYAGGARQNYMSAGQENFSNNNDVKNDIYNITNNFTIYRGKHTATIGGNYEYQYVGNMFMPASQSYYAFGSLEEFMTPNAHPIGYAYTFSRIAGKETVYSAEMKIGQLGLYVQDEININPRLKLTLGVRADRPIYPTQPLENPAITALSFPDRYGKPTNYSTGKWPKAIWYWAPRFDVRWDMNGDKSMIVRGAWAPMNQCAAGISSISTAVTSRRLPNSLTVTSVKASASDAWFAAICDDAILRMSVGMMISGTWLARRSM